MDKCRIYILIIEPSDIIFEGFENMILKNEPHFYVFRANTLEEVYTQALREHIHFAIINPSVLVNKKNEFLKLRKSFSHIKWLGLIYSYFENDILSKFDDIIHIGDSFEVISQKLKQATEQCHCQSDNHEDLSERENEVLLHLVKGLSNKEIADKLHISIHTVISHRKNIIDKTGIKSLPGLTIYAISRGIIPYLSNLSS